MKALLADGAGNNVVETLDDPTPGPGEVLIAVRASGLCGSDLPILEGASSDARYPLVPGHEVAGEVVAVGDRLCDLRVGDRVAVDPSLYCQECHHCRAGRANLCDRRGAIGVTIAGGFAELLVVPQGNCHRMPDGMGYGMGALVEPMSCVVRGLDRLALPPGSDVLVVGGGSIGVMMLRALLVSGAASVAVVDTDVRRQVSAREMGATAVDGDAKALVAQRGRGYDAVVECAGVPVAVEAAIQSADKGGRLLLFGVAPEQAQVSIRPYEIYRNELTIMGSMAVLNSFSRAVALTMRDAEMLQRLLTHQFELAAFDDAVNATRARVGGKVQIVFPE